MFNAKQYTEYQVKTLTKWALVIVLMLVWNLLVALLASLFNIWPQRTFGELFRFGIIGSLAMMGAVLWIARLAAVRFISAFYGVSPDSANEFIGWQIFGRSGFKPLLRVTAGEIAYSDETVKKIGGPGGIIVYNDSAVVLERAGKLTRVALGPTMVKLEPFEKVWDMVDLLPHRWVFPVDAITYDGLRITYEADIKFRITRTEADVFKAVTCKWIRDAHRTEPDRLMTWPKRVIISATEGSLRAILATYALNQLLENATREEVRKKLEENLKGAGVNFGVTIDEVSLGDITFQDQILTEWRGVWEAERDREVQEALTEAKARRIEMEEHARIEVRERMLRRTIHVLKQLKKQNVENPERFVILSFIQMIRNTENSLFMPDQILTTLDSLRQRFAEQADEHPALPAEETLLQE